MRITSATTSIRRISAGCVALALIFGAGGCATDNETSHKRGKPSTVTGNELCEYVRSVVPRMWSTTGNIEFTGTPGNAPAQIGPRGTCTLHFGNVHDPSTGEVSDIAPNGYMIGLYLSNMEFLVDEKAYAESERTLAIDSAKVIVESTRDGSFAFRTYFDGWEGSIAVLTPRLDVSGAPFEWSYKDENYFAEALVGAIEMLHK